MQRVRIGLTGLAGVFLLVLAAAAFFGLARQEPDAPSPGALQMSNGAGNLSTEEVPKEPLAELGVTPGNLPDGESHEAAPVLAQPATPAR
jgi:hypothetical protein